MQEKSSMDKYFVNWSNIDEVEKPVERIERLQSSLKSAFVDYQKQYQNTEIDLVIRKAENKDLSQRNTKLEEELVRVKTENEGLSQKNKKLEGEIVTEKAENERFSQRNKKLEGELVTAKAENEELSQRNEKLEEAKAANEELSERNNKLEFRNYKLKEELQKAEVQIQSSKRNVEKTRNKLKELRTTLAAAKEECDQVCEEEEEMGGAAPKPSKKRKFVLKFYEVNDSVNCPICLEVCTQSGEHSVCSLSCGHFFGRSCITQWIKKGGGLGSFKAPQCPLCSTKTTLKELRNHYVSQLYSGKEQI